MLVHDITMLCKNNNLQASICVFSLLATHCGGAGEAPPKLAETSTSSETAPDAAPAPPPTTAAAMDEPAASKPPEAPPARAREEPDYQLMPRDCEVLARAYHKSWLKDELKKRGKQHGDKVPPALHSRIERSAEQGRDQWLGQCLSIAGSTMPRKNLVCATKARSIERFDACWEGRAK